MGLEELFEAILGGAEQQQRGRRSSSGSSREDRSSSGGRRLPGLDPLPEPTGKGGIGDVMHSVVQIVAMREGFMGGMTSAWTGSGTIVHPQGIILTNCHVANPRAMGMSSPPADRLGVAITERSDRPPALSYFAQVVSYDADLDLAVIRIVADVKGRRISKLNLPSVPLGDSENLDLGHRLSIFGYPGIGGETVTYTSGDVSGFSSEKGVRSSRAWIKTDATISGGNSGGTAVDKAGFLVGVPTQAAAGSGITPVDARPVLDTNKDGRIDQRDTPMAIGGFINGLRPINLAVPLLEKAGMAISDHRGKRGESSLPDHTPEPIRGFDFDRLREKPEFSELVFSREVTDDGRPINPGHYIPGGVDAVYASFEYDNLRNGTPWSAVWMTDGKVIIEQNDTWDDGPEGRKAVKISNRKGVPDGEYHLALSIGDEISLEGKMVVGKAEDDKDSEISGQLVDSRTGRGVSGGLVIVLKPTVSLRDFLNNRRESDVQSSTETDRNGSFTLPEQLPKGQAYSLVAAARGYEPLTVEHALRLGPGAPEKADIGEIQLDPAR
ncbi:MAG: trypsin-like peptidase domain-containing protein [Planctomycetota bacterium]